MPRMDGFAFAARLRELPDCVHTALVAVSGRTDAAAQARCCLVGVGHYLFKPVDPAGVRKLLAALVADSEAANGRTELPYEDATPGPTTCSPVTCDFLGKLGVAGVVVRTLRVPGAETRLRELRHAD